MRGQRYWFKAGCIEPESESLDARVVNDWFHAEGHVRLTTGELGTELRWDLQAPCVASLQAAASYLPEAKPPYILRYHAMGWFEEIFASTQLVERRLEDIIARGDRPLTRRVFSEQHSIDGLHKGGLLQGILASAALSEAHAVISYYDRSEKVFVVHHVGGETPIGRVWGTFTSSPPCESGGHFGDSVNAAYQEVLGAGQPRYDQITALMRFPDETRRWVPYHRLLLPYGKAKQTAVAAICEIGAVSFNVI